MGQKPSKLNVCESWLKPHQSHSCSDVDLRKLRALIRSGKLAPCYQPYEGEDWDGRELEECPICFLAYPALNRSQCCSKEICTECFLQVKLPNGNRGGALCPFCKSEFSVCFKGPKSAEERQAFRAEERRVAEATLRAREAEELRGEERALKRELEKLESQGNSRTDGEPRSSDLNNTASGSARNDEPSNNASSHRRQGRRQEIENNVLRDDFLRAALMSLDISEYIPSSFISSSGADLEDALLQQAIQASLRDAEAREMDLLSPSSPVPPDAIAFSPLAQGAAGESPGRRASNDFEQISRPEWTGSEPGPLSFSQGSSSEHGTGSENADAQEDNALSSQISSNPASTGQQGSPAESSRQQDEWRNLSFASNQNGLQENWQRQSQEFEAADACGHMDRSAAEGELEDGAERSVECKEFRSQSSPMALGPSSNGFNALSTVDSATMEHLLSTARDFDGILDTGRSSQDILVTPRSTTIFSGHLSGSCASGSRPTLEGSLEHRITPVLPEEPSESRSGNEQPPTEVSTSHGVQSRGVASCSAGTRRPSLEFLVRRPSAAAESSADAQTKAALDVLSCEVMGEASAPPKRAADNLVDHIHSEANSEQGVEAENAECLEKVELPRGETEATKLSGIGNLTESEEVAEVRYSPEVTGIAELPMARATEVEGLAAKGMNLLVSLPQIAEERGVKGHSDNTLPGTSLHRIPETTALPACQSVGMQTVVTDCEGCGSETERGAFGAPIVDRSGLGGALEGSASALIRRLSSGCSSSNEELIAALHTPEPHPAQASPRSPLPAPPQHLKAFFSGGKRYASPLSGVRSASPTGKGRAQEQKGLSFADLVGGKARTPRASGSSGKKPLSGHRSTFKAQTQLTVGMVLTSPGGVPCKGDESGGGCSLEGAGRDLQEGRSLGLMEGTATLAGDSGSAGASQVGNEVSAKVQDCCTSAEGSEQLVQNGGENTKQSHAIFEEPLGSRRMDLHESGGAVLLTNPDGSTQYVLLTNDQKQQIATAQAWKLPANQAAHLESYSTPSTSSDKRIQQKVKEADEMMLRLYDKLQAEAAASRNLENGQRGAADLAESLRKADAAFKLKLSERAEDTGIAEASPDASDAALRRRIAEQDAALFTQI